MRGYRRPGPPDGHEAAQRRSLITDEATVTCVEALDENCTGEVESAAVALREQYDRYAWVAEGGSHEVTGGEFECVDGLLSRLVDER